jgi:Ca-activated chloride channel family protein
MIFYNIEFFWLLLLLLPLGYLIKKRGLELGRVFSKAVREKIQLKNQALSKRARSILMIFSLFFIIVALARPQINHGEIEVKSSFISVVAAIDMSKSMFANDIYPNRFEFAKKKFFNALEHFKNAKIALIGFSSQTFLISPLTQDFHSLKFLGQNLNMENLSLKGTDMLRTLEAASNLFGENKKKILLLFTDGGDQKSFDKEIAYAKAHGITIYIYNIGTDKGGIIKDEQGLLKDKNGDIVVVKRTDNIKTLAMQSGGAYMHYSLAKDDVKLLVNTIQSTFEAKEEESSTIQDREEIFYYPLGLAILLLFVAFFSIPNIKEFKR